MSLKKFQAEPNFRSFESEFHQDFQRSRTKSLVTEGAAALFFLHQDVEFSSLFQEFLLCSPSASPEVLRLLKMKRSCEKPQRLTPEAKHLDTRLYVRVVVPSILDTSLNLS